MRNKKFLQESMKKCWNEQMEEKQAQKERERGLALKLEEENARRLLLEEELAKATFAKKKEEMKKLQSYLLMQMEEMKYVFFSRQRFPIQPVQGHFSKFSDQLHLLKLFDVADQSDEKKLC